jgi:hypothetical protein
MSRLTLLHINIIGIVTVLLLAVILFFALIKPKQDEIATTNASVQSTIQAHGTAADVEAHKKDLAKTKVAAARTEEEWKVQSATYMPTLPYNAKSDPLQVYFFQRVDKDKLGFRDIPTVWGRWVTAWYDAQRNYGISRLPGTEFPIDAFSTDPNAIANIEHLTFPADGKPWPVRVEAKSFDEAMAHLRRFNTMQKHGMPVVSNVSLSGQSPHLEMDYTLALYIIPPPSSTPPADPRLGSRAAAGVGGMGGMGGYPGMSGGPPMGMGGGPPMGMGGGPPMGMGGGPSMGVKGGKKE